MESTWVLFEARALRGRASCKVSFSEGTPEMDLDRFECGKAFQSFVRAAGDRKVLEVRRAGALSPVFWRNPRLREPRPARTSFFLTEEQSRAARSLAFALRRGQSQTFGLRGNVIW